jgi:hypothetical protein
VVLSVAAHYDVVTAVAVHLVLPDRRVFRGTTNVK